MPASSQKLSSKELKRSAETYGSGRFFAFTEVCLLDIVKRKKASSSIGRAAVSKTAGWGFDSLLACHCRQQHRPKDIKTMTTHPETSQSRVLDIIKLLVAAAMIVGGLYAYYFYEFELALAIRVLIVLVGTGAGIAVAMLSAQGQKLWHFIQGSRVEIRKVVWPTKQETTQTAIAVFVFTLIMAIFFWLLDSGLLWLTRRLVG